MRVLAALHLPSLLVEKYFSFVCLQNIEKESLCQLCMTVTKYMNQSLYLKEKFIMAHSFGGASPWLLGPIASEAVIRHCVEVESAANCDRMVIGVHECSWATHAVSRSDKHCQVQVALDEENFLERDLILESTSLLQDQIDIQ